jgi:thiamine biosynthesis lipoprotein
MQKIDFDIIGTHLEVRINTDQSIELIYQRIYSRLHDFEQKFSRFIDWNGLHNLNLERKWTLDQDGSNMLIKMLEIARNTDGYFDPTIWKKLTELWYGNPKTHLKSHMDMEYGSYKDIEIQGNEIFLHKNIELEFGGVGKWYLIDILYWELQGYSRFLINFGGDLYGRGDWNVWLESPFAPDEIIGTICLDDIFFACSAWTKRKWGGHHHLIDPHTGTSANAVVASYVEWKTGMDSDGYATALCVMPWDMACEMLYKTPGISGVIVSKDGNIFQKEGSKAEIFSE